MLSGRQTEGFAGIDAIYELVYLLNWARKQKKRSRWQLQGAIADDF